MHEVFEHTADLGLRARAATLDQVFVEPGQALFEAICPDLSSIKEARRVDIRLCDDDREFLLFDWLKALLYHFDAEHLLLGRFEAQVQGDNLIAAAWGETIDPDRHVLEHEVKAI